MSEIVVRPAAPEDGQAIFTLVSEFATTFQPEVGAFGASYAALLEEADAAVFVAEADARIVGYLLGFDHLTLFANGRVAWVEEIMVHEDRRRQGVGGLLMSRFEDWAVDRGARLVALATRRAAPFYDALGYEASATYFRRLLAPSPD